MQVGKVNQGVGGVSIKGQAPKVIKEKIEMPKDNPFLSTLDSISTSWQTSNAKLDKLTNNIPSEMKNLMKLQKELHSMDFRTQFITKVVESVNSSIKRLGQSG